MGSRGAMDRAPFPSLRRSQSLKCASRILSEPLGSLEHTTLLPKNMIHLGPSDFWMCGLLDISVMWEEKNRSCEC